MIYTCTMNPAIDHFIETDSYHSGTVNRTNFSELQPNGKGVNISFILNKLNIDNIPLGFIGGFTGDFIEEQLYKNGIKSKFTKINGATRVNVFTNVLEEDTEYTLVNKGPHISNSELKGLLKKIDKLTDKDILFVSGSLPRGVEDNVLLEIAKISEKNDFNLILDISSNKLLECLPYQPYCIKPNEKELASWFGKENLSREELIYYGKELLKLGSQQVLISLGEEGCIYLDSNNTLYANAPSGKVVNTACSGDTLLATFIGETIKGASKKEALSTAVAAGSSTAFTSWLTDFSDVPKLKESIKVKKIKEGEINNVKF